MSRRLQVCSLCDPHPASQDTWSNEEHPLFLSCVEHGASLNDCTSRKVTGEINFEETLWLIFKSKDYFQNCSLKELIAQSCEKFLYDRLDK